MKNFRIVFSDGPNSDNSLNVDVKANDVDEAMSKAWSMVPFHYQNMIAMEIPDGMKTIGLKVEYYDSYFKQYFVGYIFIEAISEAEAIEIYKQKYVGKTFTHYPDRLEDNAKCKHIRVLETYYI